MQRTELPAGSSMKLFRSVGRGRISRIVYTAVIIHLGSASLASAQRELAPVRVFTARDSIEMARVANFSLDEYEANVGDTALFSPNGSHFLIRTRRGDLERNVNIESLLLFQGADVKRYLLSQDGEKPQPRLLVQLDIAELGISDMWAKIFDIRWINDSEVGFIANGKDGSNQAFLVDIESKAITQLTRTATNVVSFAVSGDLVAYWAQAHLSVPLVVPVDGRSILELLDSDAPWYFPPLELFQMSRSTGAVRRMDTPVSRVSLPFHKIWLSGSGNYAVTFVPSVNAPEYWDEYQIPNSRLYGYARSKVDSDPTSFALRNRIRLQLVDLRSGSARSLVDAPSGAVAGIDTPFEVFWSKDETFVVVANTYLPLGGVERELRERRRAAAAVAEIDLRSGAIATIAWLPQQSDDQRRAGMPKESVLLIEWNRELEELVIVKRAGDGHVARSVHRRKHGTWREAKNLSDSHPGLLKIERRESLTTRPKVYATDPTCGCSKEIFDPAPELERFTFGRTDVFEWADANGTAWRGGLVYPPNYRAGQAYPLVVQTHGFRQDQFLIDGPGGITTAMAAAALASAGILVLQVEDNRKAKTRDEREAQLYAEGYRAAIANLVDKGLVKSDKVGIVAFSRTGLPTIRLLADHPHLFAAATIADAGWWGYMNDLMVANHDIAEGIRRVSGGSPAEIGFQSWFANNPLYKLSKTTAAIRLEANGPLSLLGHWEHYVTLQDARRPADLIYFPRGTHVLMKPVERLGSQGGNVDWFRYWLQDFEDPDVRKVEQYARWRDLRVQRDSALSQETLRESVESVVPK